MAIDKIVALGCNEVPKFGGGQYWTGDNPDARDVVIGFDASEAIKDRLIRTSLKGLVNLGWRPPRSTDTSTAEELARLVDDAAASVPLASLPTYEPLEFYREVHAEMAAIT